MGATLESLKAEITHVHESTQSIDKKLTDFINTNQERIIKNGVQIENILKENNDLKDDIDKVWAARRQDKQQVKTFMLSVAGTVIAALIIAFIAGG
jgi:seryl-tRNA synthetase